jgi:hypothetical protein
MTPDEEDRDRILREMVKAEMRKEYAECQRLMRELLPVTRRLRDVQEAMA